MRQVTFGDFAKRAKQRHWSAESLAANVSAKSITRPNSSIAF